MSVVYLYAKNKSEIVEFDKILQILSLPKETTIVTITIENERSFRELERIKFNLTTGDIVVVKELTSLGRSPTEYCAQLKWFCDTSHFLVMLSIENSYIMGVSQPLNKAVIGAILESKKQEYNIVNLPQKRLHSTRGRSKIHYPGNWEELYKQWDMHQISSQAFLQATGLKKATFYNLITEYREQERENRELKQNNIA